MLIDGAEGMNPMGKRSPQPTLTYNLTSELSLDTGIDTEVVENWP